MRPTFTARYSARAGGALSHRRAAAVSPWWRLFPGSQLPGPIRSLDIWFCRASHDARYQGDDEVVPWPDGENLGAHSVGIDRWAGPTTRPPGREEYWLG